VAEEVVNEISDSPFHRIVERIIRNNLALAKLVDPVTRKEICAESAAPGVMTQAFAALLGGQLPDGAAEEIAGGWGLIKPHLSAGERAECVSFVEGFFAAITFKELSKAAKTVNAARLQRIIVELRRFAEEYPIDELQVFSDELVDLFLVIAGLAITMIDDLGGDAWFRTFAA